MQKRPVREDIAFFTRQLTGQKVVWAFYCDCPKPKAQSSQIEPLDMTETYKARAKLYGVKFKALSEMDFGRTDN
jgi:hypothetical protein